MITKDHNFYHKRYDVAPIQNGSHINMQLKSTFHLTNMHPMWHGHLQLKCVATYAYVASSFATSFMTITCNDKYAYVEQSFAASFTIKMCTNI
jgi:hypothetical protein